MNMQIVQADDNAQQFDEYLFFEVSVNVRRIKEQVESRLEKNFSKKCLKIQLPHIMWLCADDTKFLVDFRQENSFWYLSCCVCVEQ